MDDRQIQHLLDSLPGLSAVLDTDLRYRFANAQHVSWFGEDREALPGRHLGEVIGEQAFSLLGPVCRRSLDSAESSYTGEVNFARAGEKFVRAAASRLEWSVDDIGSILFVITDLSELKRTQQALDASTQRSQVILDTAVDAIITIDETGIIQSANAATEALFGFTPTEITGENVKILMPPEYAEHHDGYLDHYRRTGEAHIIGIGRDVTARRKDGTLFPAHLAVGEFLSRGRRYFTGFIRDMTEQKAAEEEVRRHLEELSHVNRLHAIDNLASGLAHEINQPLTAIVTMSQALLRGMGAGSVDNDRLVDTLERIVRQGGRANAIVRQMRELVRKSKSVELEPLLMDDIITDVLALLEYELRAGDIELRTHLDATRASVMGNKIQIEQVLLNLVQNAIHAMLKSSERVLAVNTTVDGSPEHVEVIVSDTGVGIPAGADTAIFDAFFTTKEQGMGQGLSISRSIIEWHGGTIDVLSDREPGAAFRFRLPTTSGDDGR